MTPDPRSSFAGLVVLRLLLAPHVAFVLSFAFAVVRGLLLLALAVRPEGSTDSVLHRVTTKHKKTDKKETQTTKQQQQKPHKVFGRRKSVAKGIVVNVTWPCGLALDVCQVLAFQKFFPFRFLPFKFLSLYPVLRKEMFWLDARTRKSNSTEPKYLSWISHLRQKSLQSTVMHTVH